MTTPDIHNDPDYVLLAPIVNRSRGDYLLGGGLLLLFLGCMYLYSTQLTRGLGVTV